MTADARPDTDMIERAAHAIFDAAPFRDGEGPYEAQSEDYRRLCRLYARAAIGALRPADHLELAGEKQAAEMLRAGEKTARRAEEIRQSVDEMRRRIRSSAFGPRKRFKL